MKEFDELWAIATKLNGPGGCSWDRKQTFESLQPYVLEEAHEVVEAVDRGAAHEIVEELGDLLYTVLFYAKVAEKQGSFRLEEILEGEKEKLIRRHPHVFSDVNFETEEEIVEAWEAIKKQEGKNKREFLKNLPALAQGQKMAQVFARAGYAPESETKLTETELVEKLFDLVRRAEASGIDAEGALRRHLLEHQKSFQKWEALL